jgi:hypothetical protein
VRIPLVDQTLRSELIALSDQLCSKHRTWFVTQLYRRDEELTALPYKGGNQINSPEILGDVKIEPGVSGFGLKKADAVLIACSIDPFLERGSQ